MPLAQCPAMRGSVFTFPLALVFAMVAVPTSWGAGKFFSFLELETVSRPARSEQHRASEARNRIMVDVSLNIDPFGKNLGATLKALRPHGARDPVLERFALYKLVKSGYYSEAEALAILASPDDEGLLMGQSLYLESGAYWPNSMFTGPAGAELLKKLHGELRLDELPTGPIDPAQATWIRQAAMRMVRGQRAVDAGPHRFAEVEKLPLPKFTDEILDRKKYPMVWLLSRAASYDPRPSEMMLGLSALIAFRESLALPWGIDHEAKSQAYLANWTKGEGRMKDYQAYGFEVIHSIGEGENAEYWMVASVENLMARIPPTRLIPKLRELEGHLPNEPHALRKSLQTYYAMITLNSYERARHTVWDAYTIPGKPSFPLTVDNHAPWLEPLRKVRLSSYIRKRGLEGDYPASVQAMTEVASRFQDYHPEDPSPAAAVLRNRQVVVIGGFERAWAAGAVGLDEPAQVELLRKMLVGARHNLSMTMVFGVQQNNTVTDEMLVSATGIEFGFYTRDSGLIAALKKLGIDPLPELAGEVRIFSLGDSDVRHFRRPEDKKSEAGDVVTSGFFDHLIQAHGAWITD